MEDNTTSGDDDSVFSNSEVSIPRPIRFWLLLLFDIPALICTILILYHLATNRTLRQGLHNHVIMILLILVFPIHTVDIPSYITYLSLGYVGISTPAFCLFWSFVDIGLFDILPMLMAFGAIERHILVFHNEWLLTRRKRLLFHYFPLSIVIVYGLLFYIIVIFFPPCENTFDYSQPWCSYPCYYDNTFLNMYDTIVNSLLPILLIVIFSITLLLRYIRQKRRTQGVVQWRKLRKMVVQLLSITSLYLIFYLPLIILTTAHLCGLSTQIGDDAQLYTYFFAYFLPLLLPYVCLASLPEVWKKLKLHWRNPLLFNNTVVPMGN